MSRWSPLQVMLCLVFAGCSAQSDRPDAQTSQTDPQPMLIFETDAAVYPAAWFDGNARVFASLHRDDTWSVIEINPDTRDSRTIDVGMSAGVGDVRGDELLLEVKKNDQYDIYAFNQRSRELTQLTNTPFDEFHPIFGVSNNQVLIDSNEQGSRDVYSFDRRSGEARRLTTHKEEEQGGRVSPDGERIAFHRRTGNAETYDIVVLDLVTGQESTLTDGRGDNSYPNWSPDGREILYSSNRSGNFDIYRVCSIGGVATQVTSTLQDEKYPVLSRDGRKVVYQINADGKSSLYSVASAGNGACNARAQHLVRAIAQGNITTVNGLAIASDFSMILATHWSGQDTSRKARLVSYRYDGATWSLEGPVFADSEFQDYQPVFSPDEQQLIFTSDRPIDGTKSRARQNVWVAARQPDGRWGDAHVISDLQSEAWDGHGAFTRDGALYFASGREGGLGMIDIYRAEFHADGVRVDNQTVLNSSLSESDFYIDPDGAFIILTRYDEATKDLDLFVSVKTDGAWSQPAPVVATNTADWELSPVVTPDRSRLVYLSGRAGRLTSIPLSEVFRGRDVPVVK